MSYELCQSQILLDTNIIPTEVLGFSFLPQHKTQGGVLVPWSEDRILEPVLLTYNWILIYPFLKLLQFY